MPSVLVTTPESLSLMLTREHAPHELRPGQNVLVWGASGGLGSFAIQLINTAGGNAIGVISEESKRDFVLSQLAELCNVNALRERWRA